MTSNTLHAKQSQIKLKTSTVKMLADTLTPVSIYLKLRDHFGVSLLFETTDFRSRENCHSIICAKPIADFLVQNNQLRTSKPDGTKEDRPLVSGEYVPKMFNDFINDFDVESEVNPNSINGFFGHTSFDAIQYFDTLTHDPEKRTTDLPDIHYSLFQYVIVLNHFKDELYIIENIYGDAEPTHEKIETLIANQGISGYRFKTKGEITSNLTDQEFKDLVTKGKYHCNIGDVFQIVLSRRFQQSFEGDDFNVYRILRSINPSPYLFYYDYGAYRIFGSSPEAQLVIKDNVASVNPIAGTYRRTGNDEADRVKATELAADPKENAEHIMLVDLARNDLGIHSDKVDVTELKEIQFFSHVIHLVSTVEGQLTKGTIPFSVFADTFPMGTLSGAPKYKALQLIDEYENCNRSFYGGAIGIVGLDGNMNQAIVIRSFLSKDNTLYYQAGAGVVSASVEEHELQEVNNKLGALNKAMKEAEKL